MFFMIGTWPGKKDLGVIDGYKVYMVYTSFVVFFIPVFRFSKQYYAEKFGRTHSIDSETGKRIEHGETVKLHFEDGEYGNGSFESGGETKTASGKICMRCKYRTDNIEFTHCPLCGNKLVTE